MAPSSGLFRDQHQVVTLAAGITAAAALGYVFLGSYLPTFGWTRKMDKDAVPGLYNRYGNDCFANCVIQVMFLGKGS
jgi:ubiquitin C-terminal hydrolase